jgi:hypothetical protein
MSYSQGLNSMTGLSRGMSSFGKAFVRSPLSERRSATAIGKGCRKDVNEGLLQSVRSRGVTRAR